MIVATGTASATTSQNVRAPLTYITTTGGYTAGSPITAIIIPHGATAAWEWYRSIDKVSWTKIDGASSNAYTPGADDVGRYLKVIATGNGNYIGQQEYISTSVITGFLNISHQPDDQFAYYGSPISIDLQANGIPTPSYKWQISKDNGGTWNDIPLASANTYNIASLDLSQNGEKYRCVVTSPVDTLVSNEITLSVGGSKTYSCTSGANADYNKTTNKVLTFIIDGEPAAYASELDLVAVDGVTLVKNTDYTVRNGSIIVELQPAFLSGLTNGNHRLMLKFTTNASLSVGFTVSQKDYVEEALPMKTESPSTGDSFSLAVYGGIVLLSMLAIILLYIKKKNIKL